MKGNAMAGATATQEPRLGVYVVVWICLLGIVAIEVALTRAGLPAGTLVLALLALAIVEAAIGVMYFMHLRYERRLLFWCLIPALLFVLVMMNQFWSDAHRLRTLLL
jgi:caa(3)-type oxidase subunit IV